MKKLVNDPQQFVLEMLKGIELANPGMLRYVPEYNLIMRGRRAARGQGADRPGVRSGP